MDWEPDSLESGPMLVPTVHSASQPEMERKPQIWALNSKAQIPLSISSSLATSP